MTVHGSKGLQAPIVILPDTVRVVGTKKEGGLLWDDIFYYPLTAGDYEKTARKSKTGKPNWRWRNTAVCSMWR